MQFKAKTLVITIALLTQFTLIASAQDESGFNFRKTRWGMTQAQVKASEKGKPTVDNETELDYLDTVDNLEANVGYIFVDDKLVNAGYLILEKHTNDNMYITDYNGIKEILTRKYGSPIKDQVGWKNNLYRDDPEQYGFAVSVGHLVMNSEWDTPDTHIQLTLHGDNFKVSLIVIYSSKKLKSLMESKEASDEEKDF